MRALNKNGLANIDPGKSIKKGGEYGLEENNLSRQDKLLLYLKLMGKEKNIGWNKI